MKKRWTPKSIDLIAAAVVIALAGYGYFRSHSSGPVKAPKKIAALQATPTETKPVIPKSVEAYSESINDVPAGKRTLEEAYALGNDAMQDLGRVLNDLSEKELEIARSKMPGFFLNPNTETIIISPVPDYFVDLARSKGTAADQDFFALEKKTSPDGLWPVYFEQQTDLSGCTQYNGKLVSLYRGWTEFQQKHPTAYREQVKNHLATIEKEFTENDCACETKNKVVAEFESFLALKPEPKLAEQILTRMKSIASDQPDMRFECKR